MKKLILVILVMVALSACDSGVYQPSITKGTQLCVDHSGLDYIESDYQDHGYRLITVSCKDGEWFTFRSKVKS